MISVSHEGICEESEGSYGQDTHFTMLGLFATHVWEIRYY